MVALRFRMVLRLLAAVLVSISVAACASMLGIEERKLDAPSSYPAQGYDGCRPGGACTGCLAVHRAECNARSFCSDASARGACVACVCESCLEPVVDCQIDAGCSAIWQCLEQTRCNLAEGESGSCVRSCQSVIEQNGGLSGEAFRGAVAIRSCAVTGACLSCLPESEAPAPGCRPQNGCTGCDDCFQQCLCSGDTFSNCRALCVADAPPAACSQADDCAGCSSCFDVCACGGGEFAECTSDCQVLSPTTCTQATGCSDCADCLSECTCGGGDAVECQAACQPPASGDVCVESTRGPNGATCGGCTGCLAECTCRGDSLEDCMTSCGLLACCPGSCEAGSVTECMCRQSAEVCAEGWFGTCDNAFGCDSCLCDRCFDKFVLCQNTAGCPPLLECMRTTRCEGSSCSERCSGANAGGEAPEAFQVAESLWACSQGQSCACGGDPGAPLQCGTAQCSAYDGTNVKLEACCADRRAETTGTAPVAIDNVCGLDVSKYFPQATSCTPKGQQNPPRVLLETCSPTVISEPPYNGAKLKGCCRAQDGICGFWDDLTGLGCLNPAMFGLFTEQRCGL